MNIEKSKLISGAIGISIVSCLIGLGIGAIISDHKDNNEKNTSEIVSSDFKPLKNETLKFQAKDYSSDSTSEYIKLKLKDVIRVQKPKDSGNESMTDDMYNSLPDKYQKVILKFEMENTSDEPFDLRSQGITITDGSGHTFTYGDKIDREYHDEGLTGRLLPGAKKEFELLLFGTNEKFFDPSKFTISISVFNTYGFEQDSKQYNKIKNNVSKKDTFTFSAQ